MDRINDESITEGESVRCGGTDEYDQFENWLDENIDLKRSMTYMKNGKKWSKWRRMMNKDRLFQVFMNEYY